MPKISATTCSEHWGGTCQRLVTPPFFDCGKNHIPSHGEVLAMKARTSPIYKGDIHMKIEEMMDQWDAMKETDPYLGVNEMFYLPSPYRLLAVFSAYEVPMEIKSEVEEDLARATGAKAVPMTIHPNNLLTLVKSSISGTRNFYIDQIKIISILYRGKENALPLLRAVVVKALGRDAWSKTDIKFVKQILEDNFPSPHLISLLDQIPMSPLYVARAI
jgi:hypothetical protein